MQNLQNFLSSIGFGKNETEIYSVLVELGTASVLEISKKTKIHRSNIYDAVRNLVQQGLVYEINQPTKLFYARPPRSLGHYLKQKEAELNEIVKDFEERGPRKQVENKIKVSKGIFSLREAIFGLLEANQPIMVFGIPIKAAEIIGPIIKDFHKERAKRKIPMLHIYNCGGESRAKQLRKIKYTEVRVMPKKYDSEATTNVAGDKVVIILWEEEITIIEIIDKIMAQTYKNYFEVLWHKAKEV